MREIKFRAWDILAGIMKNASYVKEYFNVEDLTEGKFIPLQFTGLKDKNGKEIYEGDMVTWRVNDIERTGPVYYDEQQAAFWIGRDKTTGHLVLNDWMRGEHEIIGNIYENPELLQP